MMLKNYEYATHACNQSAKETKLEGSFDSTEPAATIEEAPANEK